VSGSDLDDMQMVVRSRLIRTRTAIQSRFEVDPMIS
jgi:hypothetical protein